MDSPLHPGASVVDASTRARVKLVGADARAFLHRMSTNHTVELTEGQGRLNALLTDKGRLVDLVLHLDRGDAGVLLVGSTGKDLAAWLDRYLFTEKVELTDLTSAGSAADVAGAGAPAVVDAIVRGAAGLAPWAFVEDGARVCARTFDRVDAGGARVPAFVVVDLERANVVDAVVAAGAVRVEAQVLEAARVIAGAPGVGEITDAFTPLDLGMHDAIHWAKGCYIGQEVIARLDTYQKQRKRLVSINAAGDVAVGSTVTSGGSAIGTVTSAAGSSALAIVKLPDDGPVQLKDGDRVIEATARTPVTAQAPHE